MTADCAIFELPPVMKLEDCEALHNFFQESRGQAVTLNCASVTRMTGLSAQLVFFAVRRWSADGVKFALSDASEGCMQSLRTLGLDVFLFQEGARA